MTEQEKTNNQPNREAARLQEVEEDIKRLAAIVETSQDAIISKTLDGIITSWNQGAEQIYGYSAEEVIGRSISILVPPDRPREIPEILERLKQGEQIKYFETVRLCKDGTKRQISLSVSPIKDAGGNITGAAAIGRDITTGKRDAERFRLIVEAIPSAIVVVNQTGRIVLVNSQTETLFGYRASELLGQPVELLVPERFQPGHRHDRADYLADPQARAMGAGRDLFAVRKDGREVPVEIGLSPVETEEGLWILSAIIDITERKRAEQERAQILAREQAAHAEADAARERLAFLAEASEVLASSLDYQATLEQVAHLVVPKIADWCVIDLAREDKTLERVIVVHADPAKAELANEYRRRYPPGLDESGGAAKVMRTGQVELYPEITDALLEATVPDKDRASILRRLGFKSIIIAPMIARGRTVGAISLIAAESERQYGPTDLELVQDLARRAALAADNAYLYHTAQQLNTELEARVRQRTSQLEKTNRELEAFSYSVSHDLRAPLRAVDGFSRILLEDYAPELSPQARRYLHLVRQNSQQMGELIDDLLTFSRLSRRSLQKQPVSPTNLVRQALAELQAEQSERCIELTIGDLPPCQADPKMLKQVWLNLLANALKYTREREVAVIQIGSRLENGQSVYFVQDNGVGFDMQYKHKLFDPFQRLHRAEEYEGTGVGLATVQRIIHRHGGRVWAEAEVDKGATFYFTI